jgi:ubiquinone/menaquinone biosynthesis C-methylase UbiE
VASDRGPFADRAFVESYESWYEDAGRKADRLEKELLAALLDGLEEVRTVLEVGCGTGHFSRWFAARGLEVTGLDRSLPMLVAARALGAPPYACGLAERLPLASRSVDLVVLMTTLEFVDDPRAALAESWRVARQGILLGVLNRHSRLGRELAGRRDPPWPEATLYTVRELRRLVLDAAGERRPRLVVRTTLWPRWSGALRLPWGGFVGVRATAR